MPMHNAITAEATSRLGREDALLGDLLESSTNPVLIASPSLQVLHVNKAAMRLFRPAVPQDGRQRLSDFCGPANVFLCELVAHSIREDEALAGRNISIDGDVFDLSVHRGEAAWVVTLRPVTRELSREYRLKQLERHMHVLLRAINGIEGSVIIVDLDGRVRFLNDFTRRHVGDLLKDVDIADWPAAAGFYREDGITPLEGPDRILPRALKGQTVINQPIVVRNDLTGGSVHIRASATPIMSRRNEIVGAIGWFHDVTDRRALEAYRNGADEAADNDIVG